MCTSYECTQAAVRGWITICGNLNITAAENLSSILLLHVYMDASDWIMLIHLDKAHGARGGRGRKWMGVYNTAPAVQQQHYRLAASADGCSGCWPPPIIVVSSRCESQRVAVRLQKIEPNIASLPLRRPLSRCHESSVCNERTCRARQSILSRLRTPEPPPGHAREALIGCRACSSGLLSRGTYQADSYHSPVHANTPRVHPRLVLPAGTLLRLPRYSRAGRLTSSLVK